MTLGARCPAPAWMAVSPGQDARPLAGSFIAGSAEAGSSAGHGGAVKAACRVRRSCQAVTAITTAATAAMNARSGTCAWIAVTTSCSRLSQPARLGGDSNPVRPGRPLVAQEHGAEAGEDQPGDHRMGVQAQRAGSHAGAAQPPPLADAQPVPGGGQREQRRGHPGGLDRQQRRAPCGLPGGGRDGEHRAQDRPGAEPGQAGHRAERQHGDDRLAPQPGAQPGQPGMVDPPPASWRIPKPIRVTPAAVVRTAWCP